jgi:hypothetical protein
MKRTVTALYETREEAERARDALQAQHLAGEVEIRDADHKDAKAHHKGLGGWLSDLFEGHHDHHLYTEGLRRGHFLLVAKVDDLNETRAAEVMDAAAMNLRAAEQKWGGDGWASEAARTEYESHRHAHRTAAEAAPTSADSGSYAQTFGGVRSYTL